MKTKIIALWLFAIVLVRPTNAYADFFGGDIPLLTQIVANTLQELIQLKSILGTSQDTLGLLQDINRGIRDAMTIIRTMNTTLSPGVLSDLQNVEQVLGTIEQLYGRVPRTAEAPMQKTVDQTVAESIQLHNDAFRYADQTDPEAERIKDYARDVSPLGAERLTAQSIGVLIHVLNQVLRTNAAILKVHSEQLALQNRKEKLNSEQFKMQYEGLGQAFQELKPSYRLFNVSGNNQ